jgi:hypothetical protein
MLEWRAMAVEGSLNRSGHRFLTRSLAAVVIAALLAVALGPGSAAAYCRSGFNRLQYNGYTVRAQTSIPSSWHTSLTNSVADWRGVAGSAQNLYGPVFNDNNPNWPIIIYAINFSSIGLPDFPGHTYNNSSPPSAYHSYSAVRLNNSWTWNTSGTLNQAQRKADVHTVNMHELGHAVGLAHPFACDGGAMTDAEKASAMNPDYTKKWNLNSDDKAGYANIY